MYKKLLSNKFFRENPIDEISAQNFVYISLEVEEFNKLAEAVVRSLIRMRTMNKGYSLGCLN